MLGRNIFRLQTKSFQKCYPTFTFAKQVPLIKQTSSCERLFTPSRSCIRFSINPQQLCFKRFNHTSKYRFSDNITQEDYNTTPQVESGTSKIRTEEEVYKRIVELVDAGDYEEATIFFREVGSFLIIKDERIYQKVMQCYQNMNMPMKMFNLYEEMVNKIRIEIKSVTTYNLAVFGIRKGNKKILYDLLQTMKEKKAQGILSSGPNVLTYNLMIENAAFEARVNDMEQLLKEMISEGIALNAWTYNLLLCGYSRSKNMKKVWSVYQEGKEKLGNKKPSTSDKEENNQSNNKNNLFPNAITFSILVDACGINSEPDRIASLLREMEDWNIAWNSNLCASVVEAYSRYEQWDKVKGVFLEMKERHIPIDAKIANSFLSKVKAFKLPPQHRKPFSHLNNLIRYKRRENENLSKLNKIELTRIFSIFQDCESDIFFL